jgi:hypothetical protein
MTPGDHAPSGARPVRRHGQPSAGLVRSGRVTWVNGQIDAGIPAAVRPPPVVQRARHGSYRGQLVLRSGRRVRGEGSLELTGELRSELERRFECWARGGCHPSWNVSANVDVLALFGTSDEIAFEETLVRYAQFRDRHR